MSEEVISKEKLEERYKKVIIRTEETVTPFDGKATKRYVIDLIHDGSIYYIHIEFSPYGATLSLSQIKTSPFVLSMKKLPGLKS